MNIAWARCTAHLLFISPVFPYLIFFNSSFRSVPYHLSRGTGSLTSGCSNSSGFNITRSFPPQYTKCNITLQQNISTYNIKITTEKEQNWLTTAIKNKTIFNMKESLSDSYPDLIYQLVIIIKETELIQMIWFILTNLITSCYFFNLLGTQSWTFL